MTAVAESLVSAEWVRGRLDHPATPPRLVILDASVDRTTVDGRTAYSDGIARFETHGHIPGARHADLVASFSDAATGLPFTRPGAEQVAAALAALGLGEGDEIVVYDSWDGTWAARLWWVLDSFGIAASVLDGGLTAWVAAGLPVQTGPASLVAVAEALLPLTESGTSYVDSDTVLEVVNGGDDAILVCGLRPDAFSGDTPGFARPGHIPGSINLPWASFVGRESKLLDPAALASATAGIPKNSRIITYCGGGVNAAGVAFALQRIGFTDVAVYDGSLYEWANDASLPLETGPAADRPKPPPSKDKEQQQ